MTKEQKDLLRQLRQNGWDGISLTEELEDAIEAALKEVEDWQPIETAPVDGTIVLGVYDSPNYYYPQAVFFGTYHPNAKGNACWRVCGVGTKLNLSHWRPLPPRPGDPQ